MQRSPSAAPPHPVLVLLAFAAVWVIWGSTYLAIRVAIESLPGLLMAGVRFTAAGALLYAFGRLRGGARPTLAHWGSAALIGAMLLLVGNGCVVWAEHRIPSSLTALIVATEPLWVVLIDWVRPGGARPAAVELVGCAVGFGGVAILIGPVEGGDGVATVLPAAIVLTLGSLSWATGSLYSRSAPMPASAPIATGMKMISGGVFLFLAGTITGEWRPFDPAAITGRSVFAFFYLMVFGSLIAFSAYVFLLKVTTVARASTYAFVNPVVAVALGCAIGGEPLGWRTIAATVVIVGAVALITSVEKGTKALAPDCEEAAA